MVTVEMKTVLGESFPIVSFLDRECTRKRVKRYVFTRSAEIVIWNSKDKSTGSLYQLLQRLSLEKTVKQITPKTESLNNEEYDVLIQLFRKTCVHDVEARAKVRQFSVIPLATCVAACQAHGHTDQTASLLVVLKSLPRIWKMEIEKEENSKRNEVDLVLNEEIDQIVDETLEMYDLATELILEYVEFEAGATSV